MRNLVVAEELYWMVFLVKWGLKQVVLDMVQFTEHDDVLVIGVQ